MNSRAAPWQVEAAFGQVMRNTGTGRYRKAEGLAAARAFALHGDPAVAAARETPQVAGDARRNGVPSTWSFGYDMKG